MAAMADASGSPEILNTTVLDLHSTRGQYQSSAQLNANSST
jgi:hypothetical protein